MAQISKKKSMQNFIFTLRQIFIFAVEADTKKKTEKRVKKAIEKEEEKRLSAFVRARNYYT